MATRDEKGYIHYTPEELQRIPSFEERAAGRPAGMGGLTGATLGALGGGLVGSAFGPAGTLVGGVAGAAAGNRAAAGAGGAPGGPAAAGGAGAVPAVPRPEGAPAARTPAQVMGAAPRPPAETGAATGDLTGGFAGPSPGGGITPGDDEGAGLTDGGWETRPNEVTPGAPRTRPE
ncbi:MAG: hypothetical protein ACOY94_20300 [Bacillota bacterium]